MAIYAYRNISDEELNASRTTSDGKKYTLNHPDELVVDMRYKGEGKSNANSQGWERSSSYYFKELHNNHPEYFSKKNALRIENGESPKVDSKFVKSFPQFRGYENETLIHHHVGKDGQAVAIPQSIHKGSGEIHIVEDELGITNEAREFSNQCKSMCDEDPTLVGKSSDNFKYTNINSEIRETGKMDREDSEQTLVRRREVTPEIQQSRDRDTDEILNNYRDTLHDYGVTDESAINDFVAGEREKINTEFASLDRGDEYPQMYETPTDWEGISSSMKQDSMEHTTENETQESLGTSSIQNQAHKNALLSASNQGLGDSVEQRSSGNAFSNATSSSPSQKSQIAFDSSESVGYSQGTSGSNAFSAASSQSTSGSISGGSSGGASQGHSSSESRSQ